MRNVPESILVENAIMGDAQSMGTLFQTYRPKLYALALRICGNTPVAQDAVQDCFIKAFTHLSDLKNKQLFYPWLRKILVNNCYESLRRERNYSVSDYQLLKMEYSHRTMEDKIEETFRNQLMFDSLKALSEELRSCVLLRYFSSVTSYESISKMLGIPVGTVRSRLAAGREKLSELYFKKFDADDSAIKEARGWSDFYTGQWNNLHDDLKARNEFFDHLIPELNVRFTSGITGIGRGIIENEINDDLRFGSKVRVDQVSSSGNISIIEATNLNHPDYPDRCAPSMSLVLIRHNHKVTNANIFDSPRPQ